MGYRYYFYAVPKSLINDIRKCKTNIEYINLCKKNNIKIEKEDSEEWVEPWNLGKKIFEFGKGISFYEDIYSSKNCKRLFNPPELREGYIDYRIMVCNQEAFRVVIKSYANVIKELYQDLLRERSTNPFLEGLSQIDRFKDFAERHLRQWDCKYIEPFNIDLDEEKICNSWLYEYEIFELVRCYKTFDWKNDDLIFMGW